MKYLTIEQHELVMEILMDRLLDLKSENDFGNELDEDISDLESAMDTLDNLLVKYGDGESEEK